jgi:hypothetical protein
VCGRVAAHHRASLLATPEIISSKMQFTLPGGEPVELIDARSAGIAKSAAIIQLEYWHP